MASVERLAGVLQVKASPSDQPRWCMRKKMMTRKSLESKVRVRVRVERRGHVGTKTLIRRRADGDWASHAAMPTASIEQGINQMCRFDFLPVV